MKVCSKRWELLYAIAKDFLVCRSEAIAHEKNETSGPHDSRELSLARLLMPFFSVKKLV